MRAAFSNDGENQHNSSYAVLARSTDWADSSCLSEGREEKGFCSRLLWTVFNTKRLEYKTSVIVLGAETKVKLYDHVRVKNQKKSEGKETLLLPSAVGTGDIYPC